MSLHFFWMYSPTAISEANRRQTSTTFFSIFPNAEMQALEIFKVSSASRHCPTIPCHNRKRSGETVSHLDGWDYPYGTVTGGGLCVQSVAVVSLEWVLILIPRLLSSEINMHANQHDHSLLKMTIEAFVDLCVSEEKLVSYSCCLTHS